MSSFSELINEQSTLLQAIKRIGENFRKDGPSRKVTIDYHDDRIKKLDAFWEQFKENDIQISLFEGEKIGPYFENSVFENLSRLYVETRELILVSRQGLVENMQDEKENIANNRQPQGGPETSGDNQHEYNTSDGGSSRGQGRTERYDSRAQEVVNEHRSNVRAFERAVRNLDIENIKERWQLEDKLRTLTQRWEKIDSTYWKLDNMIQQMGVLETEYTRLERLYEYSKGRINKKIWDQKHQEKSTPKIELPTFTGSYAQWTTFKDLFLETVHNNHFISNAQKMQHLKSKLKGDPERLIQHMSISADNYEASWNIIQQRYDNKRLLFTYHANMLLNQPIIQNPTAQQLKKMHDITVESLHAIDNLNFNTESWDPLLIHILLQKLDPETNQTFTESLDNPRIMPTLDEFLRFIENKFISLESSSNTNRGKNTPNNQQQNSQSKNNVNNGNAGNNSKPKNNNKQDNKGSQKPSNGLKRFYNFAITCPKCANQHGLYNCKEFLCLSPEEKLKSVDDLDVCKNCLFSHNNKQCTSKKTCKHCNEPHSSILHDAIEIAKSKSKQSNVGQRVSQHLTQNASTDVLLATAQVKVITDDGNCITLRALLDQGSQVTLITERAAQKLQLKRSKMSAVISGIGTAPTTKCKGVTQLTIQALYSDFTVHTEALILQTLTNKLPNNTIDKSNFEHLQHLRLADPEFNISRDIDLLLGAEVYSEILLEGLVKTSTSSIIAQQTQLGWIVCGKYLTFNCHVVINNLQDIAQFWEHESMDNNREEIDSNNKCEQLYSTTTTRLPDGRYQVRLPLKDNLEQYMGKSRSQAIAQFQQLERKMGKNPSFAKDYKDFIHEYEQMGHMQPAQHKTNAIEYFLPHHGVVRPGAVTTKLRVVFNASAKTSTKYSLNDLMETGPNLQKDIFSILLKWRQYKWVLTADIEKMYRFIAVHPDHQPLQKIVWRDSPNQLIKEYQLCTVTYGTKAAPYLALRTLQQLAIDEGNNYPEAKNILQNQFFVDDALFGTDTIETARGVRDQLIQLLKRGGFNLRKWLSNEPSLVEDLPENMRNPTCLNFTEARTSKSLGLAWNPKQDEYMFTPTLKQHSNPTKPMTKRQILSDISTIFDPLGWLSPITIKAKIIFQNIWKHNINWDDIVPDDVHKEWSALRQELTNMHFNINRWLGYNADSDCELHGFCDASEKAYACVVYCTVREGTRTQVTLVAAKTKVAPIQKQQTLPRLELSGAQLLAQLIRKIKLCLDKPNIKVTAWTDSMVVLAWLQGDVTRWKAYVAHRVKEITSIVPANNWNHVRSEQNPADCASRGLTPSQLKKHPLWFNGPEWLRNGEIPKNKHLNQTSTQLELKVHAVTSQRTDDQNIVTELLNKNSCITKTIRVIAWVSRFIRSTTSHRRSDYGCYLTLDDIRRATNIIVKQVQSAHFEQEIKDLNAKEKVRNNSGLLKLNPYLDKNNILRVGGRLQNSDLPENAKHPIIIPKNSRLSDLLIDRAHASTLHGGARLTLATIRQQYWIIGGNSTVKKRLQQCVKCCRYKTTKQTQLMADLPSERTVPSPPFYHMGVDYTGSVDVKLNKGRGVKTCKGYIVVFVCMTTKAVHLELASDLSTQTFLLALSRMVARRGCPRHIYSDNGTNFVGADKELAKQFRESETFNNEMYFNKLTELGIEWHFNAPSWPTAGGLWEAAVKSMKYHLKRVLGEQKLTYEEFTTLLTDIEACMNSRPLCPLTEDIEDLDYLTPAHFLIGRPLKTIPHDNLEDQKISHRDRWELINKMKQGFWKKWSAEYLQQLQSRSKWFNKTENHEIGDVVLIKEDNIPPARWVMGRIREVHPGKDSLVRVVTLKTKGGFLTRPITKLVKLPVNDEHTKPEITNAKTKSNINQQPKQKPAPSGKGSSTLLCALLTLLTLIQPTACQTNNILTVTPFNQNKAFYFDKIGSLQSVHDEWRIVTYYNMTSYWLGIDNIQRVIHHLDERCKQFEYRTMCQTIMTEFTQELYEIQHNNIMLRTHHGQIKGRVTRGLINGVGYIANSLFGVLDERFAQQYKEDIETLQQDRDHLLTLIKGQTSIVEAHNNILKRHETTMNQQFDLISKHLNATEHYLQNLGTTVQEGENMNYFNIMSVATSMIISKLRHIQHMLIETATNIHHGHVDPRLLPQSQLLQELNTISGQLPQHLSIPVDNVQDQLADIYKLLEVKSRIFDKYFIMEITLPLTSDNQFTLYKTISVPILSNSNSHLLKGGSDYIAVNIRKEIYMQITKEDLQHCIKIEPSTYVCSINKPTSNMRNSRTPCEISSITNTTTTKCMVENTKCSNKWTPLQKVNTWLYTCCHTCQIQAICDNQITSQTINKSGIIGAKEGCIIRNDEETFYTQVQYKNSMFINPKVPTIDMGDINSLTLFNPIELQDFQPTIQTRTTDYEDMQRKLQELKHQATDTEMSKHDIHQYSISYTTLGLLLLVVVAGSCYKLWKRHKTNRNSMMSNRNVCPPPKPPRASTSYEDSRNEDALEMKPREKVIYATPHKFEI